MAEIPPLTPRQERFIACLVTCSTIRAAAAQAGVSESQAYRWLRSDDFQRHYQARRAETIDHALILAAEGCTAAAVTLRALLNEHDSPHVRLGAAKALLDLSQNTLLLQRQEARIAALERAVEALRHAQD